MNDTLNTIQFFKLNKNATYPVRMTVNAACLDLYSCEEIIIAPNKITNIKIGISLKMPNTLEAVIRPRSGLANKGLFAIIGTIDPDYNGELGVLIFNTTNNPVTIKSQTRIAQISFSSIVNCNTIDGEGNQITHSKEKRSGGFGSTGEN